MKKIFTHKQSETKEKKVVVPSDKTLDFLKQFAYTYYVDKNLPATLGGLCVN